MPDHRDSSVKKDDQVVSPARTGDATLAGMEGRGVLSLVYDGDGNLVETQGSWFPTSGPTEITELSSAKQEGRTVRYRGPIDIAETAGHDEEANRDIDQEVRITGVRDYVDNDGNERVLVSFELLDEAASGARASGRTAAAGTNSARAQATASTAGSASSTAEATTAGTERGAAKVYPETANDDGGAAMTDDMTTGRNRGAAIGTPGSDVPRQYTHEEFMALDLETIADMTGMQPEGNLDSAGEQAYRKKAWKSYELDIEHRDEWGTARQDIPLPEGE